MWQKRLQEHHWSLDACFGRALVTGEFQRGEMVCTKTLYNYVTLGLLGKIKSIDLPLRVKRKNARKRVRERKKKFGRSIDERDPSVDERQDFGHWECDLVLGSRSKDEVLLTLVERRHAVPSSENTQQGKCLCNSSLQKIEGWNVPRLFQPSVPQHYDRQWQ